MRLAVVAHLLLFLLPTAAVHPHVRVVTKCGDMASGRLLHVPLRDQDGHTNSTVPVAPFYGIRYAAPITHESRWRPPEPAACWSEGTTYHARDFGNVCVQAYGTGDEDCLFLNVYTPVSALEKNTSGLLPVMVYIHGGSLVVGDSQLPLWNVVAEGVVGVSIQYRLNIFGFLATKELTEEGGGYSGNYGFMDQQLALRWVQDHIASFGGDPSRVTLIGQSSGGTSIMALMMSPASRGLFTAAISLSGSPNITMTLSQAEVQNEAIPAAVGCGTSDDPKEQLKCMRNLPMIELVAAIPSTWFTPGIWSLPTDPTGRHWEGLPVVDGKVLAMPFLESMKAGLVDVPFILGNMAHEPDVYPGEDVGDLTMEEWEDKLEATFAPWGPEVGTHVAGLYGNEANGDPQKAYDAIVTDVGVSCATRVVAKHAFEEGGQRRSPIYGFVNAFPPSTPIHFAGRDVKYDYHGWDLQTWLQSWPEDYEPTPDDLYHSQLLRRCFLELASTGSLGGDCPEWSPISRPPDYDIFVIQPAQPHMVTNYKADVCEFYESLGINQNFWWVN